MQGSSTESTSSETKPSYLCITPDLVWSDIEESVKFKYEVFISSVSNFCLAQCSYDLRLGY